MHYLVRPVKDREAPGAQRISDLTLTLKLMLHGDHATMLKALGSASASLQSAVDHYLAVCLSIKQSHQQGRITNTTPQEHFSRLNIESLAFPTLQLKLKQASAALNWTRNLSNTLAPINKLPPELLVHIFQLLLGWQARAEKARGSLHGRSAKHPGALSHVCCHWRQVAIECNTLWTHIDLFTLDSVHQGLLDRARTYAQRAHGLLLDVRLTDPPNPGGPRYGYGARFRFFFKHFAPRIKSMELVLQKNLPRRIQDHKLSAFFEYCVPGTFTKFIARKNPMTYDKTGPDWNDDDELDSRILPSDDRNHDSETDLFLKVDEARLEEVFRCLTILHLDRVYLPWSSSAYHGLVELRLTGEESIHESDLVKILSSSPGLHTLELGIRIEDSVPLGTPIRPIALQNLEALYAHRMDWDDLGLLFRWVAPGTGPIFLSLNGSTGSLDLSELDIESFFGRSNVTRLYASFMAQQDIIQLLRLCPRIEILAIEESELTDTSDGPFSAELPSLNAVYMLRCEIETEVLVELVQPNKVRTLGFYKCPCFQWGMKTRLSAFCPDVRGTLGFRISPNLVEEWDMFAGFGWK